MIKTDWKAKLKTTIAVKEKTVTGSNSQLTKADKSIKTEVSSVFVSAESKYSSVFFENIFDSENEVGTEIIRYLRRCVNRGISISLFQPTVEAYNDELSLVSDIQRRIVDDIEQNELKQTVDKYVESHHPDRWQGEWTGRDVPLFYLRLLRNEKEIEAYTCNQIQSQIITAFCRSIYADTEAHIQRI